MKPYKVMRANTLSRLVNLQKIMEEMGYVTKLVTASFSLEIYKKEDVCQNPGMLTSEEKKLSLVLW